MRILLLADTFNSLTQRLYAELTYRHHELSVELALSDEIIGEAVDLYQPELIIAPFLTKIIPKRIWCRHVCIIDIVIWHERMGMSPDEIIYHR